MCNFVKSINLSITIMKIHKQCALVEATDGYVDVVSYYDTVTCTFGADIYYQNQFAENINLMKNEPHYDHLIALGYNFLHRKESYVN